MFYEVTITYPKNKKKKIISSDKLSRNYWTEFDEKQKRFPTKKNFNELPIGRQT